MVLIVFAVSLLVVLAVTPFAGRLAVRWGFIDRPADHKFHDRATPLLGGLALYTGIVPVLLLISRDAPTRIFAVVVTVLFLIGLWDDRHRLSVGLRLSAQAVAAVILVAAGFRAELALPVWAAAVLSFLWIVGITNAFNLLDSMDGAATGVAAIAAAGFLLLTGGSTLGETLAVALLGAMLGFLPYNLPPARIFMGDGGSMLVGFSLAVLGLAAKPEADAAVAWMVPVLLLGVLIFDTTLVCVSRLRLGKNPMTHPGKDHFAHRLARRGFGVRGALVFLYLAGASGILLAHVVLRSDRLAVWVLSGVVVLAALVGIAWLERPVPDKQTLIRPSRDAKTCSGM